MTDQQISGPLASKGWLCHSKTNRLMMFDASYLHGVLPGRGACPHSTSNPARRLTFMVGFWKTIAATDRGLDHPGPGNCSFNMLLSFLFGYEVLHVFRSAISRPK
jgi:hypothetical protein